jgi:uncharacterized protein with GYD domain
MAVTQVVNRERDNQTTRTLISCSRLFKSIPTCDVIISLKSVYPHEVKPLDGEGGFTMETYIILGKYTEKGATNIKEGPARIEAARKAVEGAGGKWLGWYLTMGQYDFVVIAQAKDAKAVAAVLLASGSLGNFSSQTLRAFTEDEFKGLVASLP